MNAKLLVVGLVVFMAAPTAGAMAWSGPGGGGGGGGGGGCTSGPARYSHVTGSFSYSDASVQANEACGTTYNGVYYGHYGERTNWQGGGWKTSYTDSGCSTCQKSLGSSVYSRTQVWTSSCYSCADMSIKDSEAYASI